jgi:hypothetical protein
LFYVAFRFEYRFALGSIAALIHDVIITLGIFSLLQIEFDLTVLAAICKVPPVKSIPNFKPLIDSENIETTINSNEKIIA